MAKHRDNPAVDAFRAALREFYISCGEPPYKDLVGISVQLKQKAEEWYSLPTNERRKLPTLSKSALSEHLNGRRKRLPNAGWLTVFVLSCQRRAWELGGLPEDPGTKSLPEWHHKRNLALAGKDPSEEDSTDDHASRGRAEQSRSPRGRSAAPRGDHAEPPTSGKPTNMTRPPADSPSGRGRDTGGPAGPRSMLAGLSVACAQPESPAIAASAALRTAVIQSAVPVHLPEPLRDYVAGYGPYGSKLLADAQDRVIEAVYQLAVLLLAADSVNGSAEAHRLLIYAAAAEHPAALDLLDANPHLDRLDAAGHACALADAAAATGRGAMAMIFYECAARGGLPAASVKLADALLADGRQAQAVHWLAMAAHQGDLRAEIRLETLRRTGHVPVPPGTAAVIDR